MRIGIFEGASATIDELVGSAAAARESGFASWWMPQIFGWEALSVLAVVGREVPDISLGTAVVPVYPRHPVTLAAQTRSVQSISGGRLTLGIGLSHQMVIEGMFGMSFHRPVEYLTEYLAALLPLVREGAADATGSSVSAHVTLDVPGSGPAEVLVAALGPKMLALAGAQTEGTVTWMTGPRTLAEHIVPSITAAATAAGRGAPRVVAALPVAVTDEPEAARAQVASLFEIYGFLPSYRAMLDREGADGPADVALVGDEETVASAIRGMAESGVTEFVAVEFDRTEPVRSRTRELLVSLL